MKLVKMMKCIKINQKANKKMNRLNYQKNYSIQMMIKLKNQQTNIYELISKILINIDKFNLNIKIL